MGIPGSANLLLAAAAAESYQIDQSLRFDGNSFLQRSPSASGNEESFTISLWVKGMEIDSTNRVVSAWIGGGNYEELIHIDSGQLNSFRWANAYSYRYISNARYRDITAWYHIVLVADHTNATASLRRRYYINGQEITSWSTETDPAQNLQGVWNSLGTHAIGALGDGSVSSSTALKGYLAEVHHVDGQVLGPTSFGEYDVSGVWRPIEYTGTYGTEGWYLKFDPTAANGIGHDHSGNGNNWTPSGFATSGVGTDVMSDTPTNNWCTGNALAVSAGNGVWTSNDGGNGNLDAYLHNTRTAIATIPFPTTGKWYCEITPFSHSGTNYIGISDVDNIRWVSNNDSFWSSTYGGYAYTSSGNKINNGTSTSYGASWQAGDVIGVAFDAGGGALTFYKNGATQGTAFTSISTSKNWVLSVRGGGSAAFKVTLNFGQREFAYPPGTASATDYFNTVTYTGSGSTQSITGVGFQPDFVWIKGRDNSDNHTLHNSVVGATKYLYSNSTATEVTTSNSLTSFDTDGFSLGSAGIVNRLDDTYVAWCWKAGGTASANNSGSLNATVSANQDAGFSVVTYTGNSVSGATFAHGLSAAPTFVVVKNRDSGSQGWMIFHASLGNTKAIQFTASSFLTDTSYWNDTTPSNTLVTLGNDNATNASGDDFVAYCWTDKTGVTKTGAYTGNGSDPGNISVDCGFKPAMVMVKGDASASWQIIDNERGEDTALFPDSSAGENSRSDRKILLTQSGFIVQGNDGNINSSGVTYYFIAFAENFSADTDHKEVNTKNLPAPDIKDGSDYFNTVTYTGDGQSSQAVTGAGFQPNLSWVKNRSRNNNHVLQDSVRGITASNGNQLVPNSNTIIENSNSNGHVGSYDSDGFTVEDGTSGSFPRQGVNYNNDSYVAWLWKAGAASGSSNTAGTITSTVSASPSSGFSIATYTGNGTDNATVGHGLGVEPSFYIIFNRGVATFPAVWHSALTDAEVLRLSENTEAQTPNTAYFQPENNSSTVISLGTNDETNANGDNYVAYIFAEVEGYCKVSSYIGNGDNNGVFVYTGFRPSFVLTKRTNSTSNWIILDNTRDIDNPAENWLRPNSSGIEESTGPDLDIDFLANGFKIRNNGTDGNISGSTYAYISFAENPFGGDGVSPATAR